MKCGVKENDFTILRRTFLRNVESELSSNIVENPKMSMSNEKKIKKVCKEQLDPAEFPPV